MNGYGMSRIGAVAAALGLAAVLGTAAVPAFASQGGSLQVTVTPIDEKATYTQVAAAGIPARPSFLGYTVSIRNIGRSTVTQIRFAGTTSVTDAQERATLNSIVGVSGCVVSAGGTSIDCPIGKLKSGEAFPTFQVLFNTPVKDATTPTPDGNLNNCAATDCVSFSGRVFVAGNKAADGRSAGGNPNSPPSNFSQAWTAAAIALGTPTNTNVRSLVLANGGVLFTGTTGVPIVTTGSDNNPFTTAIGVPPIGNTRTAAIEITDETSPAIVTFSSFDGPPPCSVNLTQCFLADVTVPGSFSPFLTIVLRQDKKTIKKVYGEYEGEGEGGGYRVPIENIVIKYTGGGTPTNPTYVDYPISLCQGFPASSVPNGPSTHPATTPGLPCIAKRRVVPHTDPIVNLRGDYEWTIYNVVNGGYRVR
jgi:hypothetical protein